MSTTSDTLRTISSRGGILSALAAVILVLSVPALVYLAGTGAVTVSGAGMGLMAHYALITTMGAVRLFGQDTLEAVRQARGGSDTDE